MPGDFAHALEMGSAPRPGAGPKLCWRAATFAENIYDHEVYEHAHRLFCSRLEKAGLRRRGRGDELATKLGGALDFPGRRRLRAPRDAGRAVKKGGDARCAHLCPGACPG